MAKKILVCDRCQCVLAEREDIELSKEGENGWAIAARARGSEPRGLIPCRNFIRCGGEMIITKKRNLF